MNLRSWNLHSLRPLALPRIQAQPSHAFVVTSVAASTLLSAGNANAATELMDIAAGDNRVSLLLTLFVPALVMLSPSL